LVTTGTPEADDVMTVIVDVEPEMAAAAARTGSFDIV